MTKPRPFSFDEFRAPAPRPGAATQEQSFTVDDIEAARAEGVAEGRSLAMASIAADETAQLQKIADLLLQSRDGFETELSEFRAALIGTARVFLEEFCTALAQDRELAIADDLLRKLTENSEDRRSARLFLNPRSAARLKSRIEDAMNRRGVGDFVTLESDPALSPGEARLEWRGGDARRGRAEINAAIAALFDPIAVNKTETPHERA